MKVISTCHKAGWDQYGQGWLDGIDNWPKAEFILYTEGFDLDDPRVDARRIEDVDRAVAFKKQYAHYRPLAWRWDIVRFSNKVFAAYDALYNHRGLAVWLDADCMTYNKIPDGYIDDLLPIGKYLAMFKRIGWQTETGFWVMDCSHKAHKPFMDMWIKWVESGAFKQLTQWCDASTLDATVRGMEKVGLIETVSLSAGFEKEEHPMAKVDLARFCDHLKGRDRKLAGRSKENEFREVA